MIFVTVGTTHFDDLIETIDNLVASGQITDQVTCQIGGGTYEPRHCEHFRFKPSIDEWFQKADLVITHGGSTVFALLAMGKPFVAVPNTSLTGDHQTRLLDMLGEKGYLIWTRNVNQLAETLIRLKTFQPVPFAQKKLTDDMKAYIATN